jgi:translin
MQRRGAMNRPLADTVAAVVERLAASSAAREVGLPACRRVIRASGSSIRALHRGRFDEASALRSEAGAALAEAVAALSPHPAVYHAGFLHDAAKEYVEASVLAAMLDPASPSLPGPDELGVESAAWLNGVAEAASELRRNLLDRLREGSFDRAEALLGQMEDAYDALVVVDLPDALSGGLRRTVDALRAVLERSRGDVTTTVLQERLRRAIDDASGRDRPPAAAQDPAQNDR